LNPLPEIPPIESILVATDLSAASTPAVRVTAFLAKALGANWHILRVLPEPGDARIDGLVQEFARNLQEESQAKIEELARELPLAPEGIQIATGKPVDKILEGALGVKADLLVIGTHGTNHASDLGLGSTAVRLASNAPFDLLLVPPQPGDLFQRPLLGLENTRAAFRAASRARQLVEALALPSLEVVHAFDLPLGWGAGSLSEEEWEEKIRGFAMEDLEPVVAALETPGCKPGFRTRRGSPEQVLEEAVKKHRTDLVLLGSRHRTPLMAMFLGDTARNLLHHLTCAVWLVRDLPQEHPLRDALLRDLGLA